MRFIGNKQNLLDVIDNTLKKHLDGSEKSFVDLFAGSNSVGMYFSNRYEIISNDVLYFSYAMARGTLGIKKYPTFDRLKKIGIDDPLKYLNSFDINSYHGDFVTREYSPDGLNNRKYFTVENAKFIDFYRNTINEWRKKELLDDNEFFYLLNILLSALPSVSNTTGTYGAFLKKWDNRAFKRLAPEAPILLNKFNNRQYNTDSIKLVSKIKDADIVYIDTPYNTRQYPSNYHVLEMIAKWNKPKLKGVTGQPNLDSEKSDFAVKRKAYSAMNTLLSKTVAKHVLISYSTDGIIPELELINLIKKYSKDGKVEIKRFAYRKYKSKIHNNNSVKELLFYYVPKAYVYRNRNRKILDKNQEHHVGISNGFIKSPLNYVGGKYKLLPQLLPQFPSNISTFVDLFSGGANVGINMSANKIIFNDINSRLNGFFRYIQAHNTNEIIENINYYINKYSLSKTNEAGFLRLRSDYNVSPSPVALYVLVSYSFNYQFRFNNSLDYNNPFGKNRSHFSKRMENNLIKFTNRLHGINAIFLDEYFAKLDFSNLDCNSFVYADPPYLITTSSYNDGTRGFGNWTEEQELQLYDLLDSINNKGIKFALSNVLTHKGLKNKSLITWSSKYNIHHLKYGYQNASHNTVHTGSDEVLITNY